MTIHEVLAYGKKIKVTDTSVFRVEQRKLPKGSYEGLYAHKDIHKAINFYQNTPNKSGYMIRLVKDGDEFIVINKQS
jgi:hypothetical protein